MPASEAQPNNTGQYFPFSYLEGFLHFLRKHRDVVRLITYDDLNLESDRDYSTHYAAEYEQWKARISRGDLDPTKIYVLLQHDVDRDPDRTHAALSKEDELRLRSNVMIFNRKIERSLLRTEGRIEHTSYDLDYAELKRLRRNGFVVGYHTNAVERALFDFEKAKDVFRADVEELAQHFPIRYFSPHGGVRDSRGRSNAHLDPPDDLMSHLRWVQNRFTVRFAATFSDGAIAGVNRDPTGRDLRRFVRTWEPGKRYRVLLHPQYYNDTFSESPTLSKAAWYVDLCAQARRDPYHDPWGAVDLAEKT